MFKAEGECSVDVIIPTLNSEKLIEDCLRNLLKQRYKGKLNIMIIDGGSTDRTLEIANKFGVNILVRKGMYGVGKNGARHLGELTTNSPFIWYVDSDNIMVEDTVLSRLVEPLVIDPNINISIPMTALDKNASSFNNAISINEIRNVENMAKNGIAYNNGYILLQDMNYGLTNCALVRRTAAESVGGFDMDVRMLDRLRRLGLSKGIIDTKSHFYHNQVDSLIHYLKKWNRRLKFYSKFSEHDLNNYFVDYQQKSDVSIKMKTGKIWEMLSSPLFAVIMFYRSGDRIWLWMVVYPFAIMALVFIHPIRNLKVFRKFL